ncbi:MAG: PGPGW domain-containing protein [bacterium]|nr:PGPGW domain-containing protein [bacterium]
MNLFRHTKRVFITIIGMTVILIAFALFVLPGPGILVLIIGLMILATEYEWAKKALKKANHHLNKAKKIIKK